MRILVPQAAGNTFGHPLKIPMPDGTTAVILARQGHSITPYKIILPHQLYAEDLEREIGDGFALLAISVNPLHWTKVAER